MTWCVAYYDDPIPGWPSRKSDVIRDYGRKKVFDVAKDFAKREKKFVTVKCEFPCPGGLTADWYEVHPDGTVIQTGEGVR